MAVKINSGTNAKIVIKDASVTLSDEKLKGILLRTYERAQRDMREYKWYDHYGKAFSVAVTLGVSLATSTFNAIWCWSSEEVTFFAKCILAISTVLGIVSALFTVSDKACNDITKRDEAIKEMFEQHCSKDL